MNTWILLQMSVISLLLQRWSRQGFIPSWGAGSEQGVCKEISVPLPCRGHCSPELSGDGGGGIHICRSQELRSLCGSLLAPCLRWQTATSSCRRALSPKRTWRAGCRGCGGQKYWGFRKELVTFALPGTTSLTNYEANSKSITEGLP